MVDRPSSASSAERRTSQIPLPTNKRSSMSLTSVLQQSNLNAVSSPKTSPTVIGPVPPGKKSPRITKRNSLAGGSSTGSIRKNANAAPLDIGQEDPAHLKAQIALLQSSLYASHQRIMDLTADMNLDTSLTASPSTTNLRPYTPMNGTDHEVFTPMTDASHILAEEDELDSPQPIGLSSLPKSKSNYDLSRDAATPGREVQPGSRKTSDGPGISRIPRASVAHARLMHDASPGGTPAEPRPANGLSHPSHSPIASTHLKSPFSAQLDSPYSPATSMDGRLSPHPGLKRSPLMGSVASTKVIDGLQTDLINTKGHVEKLKQEMRSNQRLIGSLTRQNEDLKETKERMRVEVEGLNNVISRKERLLQEVLERARSAESSLAEHLGHKKAMEDSTKKFINEMTAQVKEATLARGRAESDSSSLRDGIKSLKEAWARELKAVKEEMRAVEEAGRKEREEAMQKRQALVRTVKAQSGERANIQRLAAESAQQTEAANVKFQTQIAELRAELDRTARENKEANTTARWDRECPS
ncbi:hypothetical protein BD324DRAFT_625854 [Kockovaella imperatae]|uniref:SWI5-dependent HO expression protein 3 n=1 Tax=Kockovaella imperatae TaxID=4999 RepID=A0A1Y1UIP3_9TREE|nr:hypothetical protein BD324DRAFT_625854 [Kockovaella imperatae]ORX37364.1 hypothetical protein BD324DRAFT_625854 [Kockovaella imperatae]